MLNAEAESLCGSCRKSPVLGSENPNLNLKSELKADVGMLSSRSLCPECVHWTLLVETAHDV